MKTTNLLTALFLLVLAVTACSLGDRIKQATGGSSSNTNDNTVVENTGIPECDKLFAKVEEKASDTNKESSILERAAYSFIKEQIMKPIRDEIANKNDKDKKNIARKCTEAYDKLIEEEKKDADKK